VPEIREDVATGRRVIIAPERAARPQGFAAEGSEVVCPFCVGQEHLTPHETFAIGPPDRQKDQPPWTVRIVPNKYPALVSQALVAGPPATNEIAALGHHEVVIETPRHLTRFSELSLAEAIDVFTAYRDRLAALAAEGGHRFGLVFKNCGAEAGATLPHLHSQLMALPAVPVVMSQKLSRSAAFEQQSGGCLWCDMLARELADGRRIVAENDHFVAFCSFAGRFPYEMCILPRQHASRFTDCSDPVLASLAQLMRDLVGRLEAKPETSAYNYWIHTLPFDTNVSDHYHWHVEIVSRMTTVAGFEWGSGWFINPVCPEDAARLLRNQEGWEG
jgi:UDPglucose--hexose-1-phosphate uridylyltransferase